MSNDISNFKKDLHLIEIELFSFCNRTCWFCPNSVIDRRSKNIEMSEKTYLSILEQLRDIEFNGEITYSRYNEPLSQKELFLKRIAQARELLPNCKLKTNTNGDYLTQEYIKFLHAAGLNELFIQQYSLDKIYDHEKLHNDILNKIKKLNLPYELIYELFNYKIEYKLFYENMRIQIRARNFNLDGSSRGEMLDLAKNYTRIKKCTQPFTDMYIDYNGNVMVCCALRSDIKNHTNGLMGNVNQSPIWDIYYNEKYTPWRNHHLNDGPKEGVCKTCKHGLKYEDNI
jgi:radical SAM protein with 4Fe4S-binding SPASM domain